MGRMKAILQAIRVMGKGQTALVTEMTKADSQLALRAKRQKTRLMGKAVFAKSLRLINFLVEEVGITQSQTSQLMVCTFTDDEILTFLKYVTETNSY